MVIQLVLIVVDSAYEFLRSVDQVLSVAVGRAVSITEALLLVLLNKDKCQSMIRGSVRVLHWSP